MSVRLLYVCEVRGRAGTACCGHAVSGLGWWSLSSSARADNGALMSTLPRRRFHSQRRKRMDGPTRKQYGILLLDKGVDGWVGWRAYRYQIIQELEKLFGKEELAFYFFTLGSVCWLFVPFPLSILSFCSLSSLTRWLCDFCLVFWEIIRVRVRVKKRSLGISDRASRVARPAACFAFCAALLLLLLRYSGIYRKSFLASLHFFFWCVVHCPVWLSACGEPDVEMLRC